MNRDHVMLPLYAWTDFTPDEVDAELATGYPTGRIKTVHFGCRIAAHRFERKNTTRSETIDYFIQTDFSALSVYEARLLLREYRERDKVAFLVFRKPGELIVIAKEPTI